MFLYFLTKKQKHPMKALLFIAVAIIILPIFALAETEDDSVMNIFSNYVENGGVIVVKGVNYTVSVTSQGAFLDADGTKTILSIDICKEVSGISFCLDAINESIHNASTDEFSYKAKISVTMPVAQLELTRLIS